MKRLLATLLAGWCLFCAGCGATSPTESSVPDEPMIAASSAQLSSPDEWGISLSAKYVTPSGLTIVCTQSGGNPTGELHTGSYYSLEQLQGNDWVTVEMLPHDFDIAWTDEAWIIPMESSVEWPVKWDWLYGELSPGTYRIGKEIDDFRGTGDFDTHFCYAEFDIP